MRVALMVAVALACSACAGPAPSDDALEAAAFSRCPGAAAYARERRRQPPADGGAPVAALANPALKSELSRLVRRDQEIRRAQLKATPRAPTGQDVARLSAETTHTVKHLFGGRFPSVLDVGTEGVEAAFVLVQHAAADPEFQQLMLRQMNEAPHLYGFRNGEPAMLADKILVTAGRPQRWGTQFKQKDGRYVPLEIDEPATVDQRRNVAGLMPLADYACLLNELMKPPSPASGAAERR